MPAPEIAESVRRELDELSLYGPLLLWIGTLSIGLVLDIVPAYVQGAGIDAFLMKIASYIIYMPGVIVLPLVASLWMGARVGSSGRKPHIALYAGLVNAVYASLIYMIAIFIMYLILVYVNPSALTGITLVIFLEYLMAVPATIAIVLVPIFSSLSAARRRR